jgi:phosphatidate cytidylyltransferase
MAAAIMIPVALAAAWHSPAALAVLSGAAGIAMAREWSRLAHGGPYVWTFWFCTAAIMSSLILAIVATPDWAWMALVGVALLAAVAARAQEKMTLPVFAGILIIAGACLGLVWLRALPAWGLETVLWVFAIVWATDSAAFAVGAAAGGPRMAPTISPKKTWSGATGGLIAGALASFGFTLLLPGTTVWVLIALGAAVSLVSQLGDLAESGLKRQYGVKDMSTLIPGHGGVLDRLDGLIAATIFVCLLTLWGGASPLTFG